MIHQCSSQTKKKKPCPIEADRLRKGQWFCHVHDPDGTYRQQLRAKAVAKMRPRNDRKAHETERIKNFWRENYQTAILLNSDFCERVRDPDS